MTKTDYTADKELVAACLQGERAAQEKLYRSYADELYNVALIYAKSDEEACDILQEGFVKIFRGLENFHFDSALKTWMRRIVVNTALDFYRKNRREREQQEEYHQQSGSWSSLSDDLLSRIHAKDLVNLVNRLPDKASLVLKLYALEGYAHREIAEKLGISEGTSKSQLSRARELLKALIKNLHDE